MAKQTKESVATKVTSNQDGTIFWYGKTVLMERHSASGPDGLAFQWSIYALEPVTDGRHPHHGDDTTETHVWMKKGEGDEAHAHALCKQLSGISD